MTLYFAYGSNMSRADMAGRCPCALALGVAKLTGWRFIVADAGYASIAPALGGQVIGVLWRLTPRGLAALNAFESLDSGLYVRRQVMVRRDGDAKSAMVYVARNGGRGRPRPRLSRAGCHGGARMGNAGRIYARLAILVAISVARCVPN